MNSLNKLTVKIMTYRLFIADVTTLKCANRKLSGARMDFESH